MHLGVIQVVILSLQYMLINCNNDCITTQDSPLQEITKADLVFFPLLLSKKILSLIIQLQSMMNVPLILTQITDYGVQLKQMNLM